MNPLSHAQIAQDTHREIESRYGNRDRGDQNGRARASEHNRYTAILALSGASVFIGAILTLVSLF